MADTLKEERIRIRAHEIWERDGSPHGQQDDHWHRARREIEMEDEDAEGLQRTLTETMGLTVGLEPQSPLQDDPSPDATQTPEGDHETAKRVPHNNRKAKK
jgi:hypothetical protein